MSWVELQLVIPRRVFETVSGRLFEVGAIGCQEDYLPGEQPPVRQPWDTGPASPLPDRLLLRAWWDADKKAGAMEAVGQILLSVEGSSEPRWVDVKDDGWADTWKLSCERVEVMDGWAVAPPWKAEPGDIIIEPGMAFGTGDHPTTLSCLRAVVAHAQEDERCLDVGTGSGVLAICAARLGMNVRGIDIDPESVRAVLANAQLNQVDVVADLTPLDSIDEQYELVVANLFAEVLVMLASDLKRVTGRHLAVAGVLADRAEMVVEALQPMRLVKQDIEGDWCHMGFEW